MKNFSNEELATITSALQNALDYVRQKETLAGQVSDLLGLLIPGDGRTACSPWWERGTAHQLLSPKLSNGWQTSRTVKRTSGPGA